MSVVCAASPDIMSRCMPSPTAMHMHLAHIQCQSRPASPSASTCSGSYPSRASSPCMSTHSDSVCSAPPRSQIDQDLKSVLSPGDVLFVKGDGQFTELGTTGGWMGHVLVVRGEPELVSRKWFQDWGVNVAWPGKNVTHIWKVPTIESTRSAVGLHQCDMLVHIRCDGTLVILGELVYTNENTLEFSRIDEEAMEVWQSPAEIRSQLRMDCIRDVLTDMVSSEASWSLTTAARAVFKSAKLSRRRDLLGKVQGYWESAPICTSVVISFWQRYLCSLARATGQREADLILRWMPLKADRVLPGELISTMHKCGWGKVTRAPKTRSSLSSEENQDFVSSTPLRAHSFDTAMLHRVAVPSLVLHQHGQPRTTSFIVASR